LPARCPPTTVDPPDTRGGRSHDSLAIPTEEAYVAWIRRYIVFHGKRHPAEMGAPEATKFLTSLAVDGQVAASTQNQALSALLFLSKHMESDAFATRSRGFGLSYGDT
jgi:hypothetical protein